MKKLIYPYICRRCGVIYKYKVEKITMGMSEDSFLKVFSDLLCTECIKKYEIYSANCCERCGKKIEGSVCKGSLCGSCLNNEILLDKIRSPFSFSQSIVDIVHLFKYNDACFMAGKMAFFLLKIYKNEFFFEHIDFVLPVPMHRKKLRRRGYNQALLMSLKLSELAGIYGVDFPPVMDNILLKSINTTSQTKLGLKERQKNIKGAFLISSRLPDRISLRKKKILLIDDVITTGSTLNECAKSLINAGVSKVFALTFARA